MYELASEYGLINLEEEGAYESDMMVYARVCVSLCWVQSEHTPYHGKQPVRSASRSI